MGLQIDKPANDTYESDEELSLDMVDAVLLFSGRNATRILKTLHPAFHAKGTDYTVETVPERELSNSIGIETVIVGDPKSHASSEVMK